VYGKISNGGLPEGESFGSEDALGHVGAARRELILIPRFFIVDTDSFLSQ